MLVLLLANRRLEGPAGFVLLQLLVVVTLRDEKEDTKAGNRDDKDEHRRRNGRDQLPDRAENEDAEAADIHKNNGRDAILMLPTKQERGKFEHTEHLLLVCCYRNHNRYGLVVKTTTWIARKICPTRKGCPKPRSRIFSFLF